MAKKKIIMALLVLLAVGLLALKLGPIFMPRSWRAKRAAKKAGRPIPKTPKKKKRTKRARRTRTVSEPAASKPPSKPGATFDIANLNKKISEASEILLTVDNPVNEEAKTPFMKYVVEKKEEEKPTIGILVSGILWDSENPLAIINGEIYSVGEKVGGICTVEKIGPGFVVLSEGGKKTKVVVGSPQ